MIKSSSAKNIFIAQCKGINPMPMALTSIKILGFWVHSFMACQAPAPTWLHPVNASVRDPDDPTKTERLLALDGAKERLHLFKAVFPEEGSFDSMVDGCEGVFHTASPFCHTLSNPQVHPTSLLLLYCKFNM
ncbi:phenylacetaldehyde reductase isoform X1 [Vitis vinifera]|nr:phenylacetaldehyde reductase isoform X1 [Vitis vinifera]|eukprot:XP_010659455.1 PREDICTED: tetraketide alpha-pyrone reductase 1 isoform X1 [Vitis vinifera]